MREFENLHFERLIELDLNAFKRFIENKLTLLQATILNSF